MHNTRPLTLTGNRPDQGFGKIGNLPKPMQGRAFIHFVTQRLKLEAMMLAGPLPETVSTIAVCGGSGSDLADAALQARADVYITAELKHSVARWAEENGLCIIDAGHFATENIIIPFLLARMTAFFAENNHPAPVMVSQRQNSPLRFYIAENMPTII